MGIAKDSIESLKLKAKISDFVLSSTTGKIRGNKGMALCPFHGEKTASMSFTDEENLIIAHQDFYDKVLSENGVLA